MSMLRLDHIKIAESLANYSEQSLLSILAGKYDSNFAVMSPDSDSINNIYYMTAAWKYLRQRECTDKIIVEALSQYPSSHMKIYTVGGLSSDISLINAVDYVINTMLQPILTSKEAKEFKALLELAEKAGPLPNSETTR
ncbi:TPA: hypothetical protein ACPJ0Z_003309 [Vibrio diabolicus]